jgi:hypothetical protein
LSEFPHGTHALRGLSPFPSLRSAPRPAIGIRVCGAHFRVGTGVYCGAGWLCATTMRWCPQQEADGSLSMLESDYAAQLSGLIREYLQEGASIPAFLSAATLQLFRGHAQGTAG